MTTETTKRLRAFRATLALAVHEGGDVGPEDEDYCTFGVPTETCVDLLHLVDMALEQHDTQPFVRFGTHPVEQG